MTVAVQFDTLDYSKRLETTGVPAAQAGAQARLLTDVLTKSVTSPGDVVTLERNIAARIDAAEP